MPLNWKFIAIHDVKPGLLPNTPVVCICGRRVPADMMIDVRALKLTKDEMKSLRVDAEPEFLCDGCRSHLLRKGTFRREDLAKMHGAPVAVQNRMRLKDEDEHPRLRINPNHLPHRK